MTETQKKLGTILSIPVFIINLKKRKDRKINILKEFNGRSEFSINIINPLKHSQPAISLWITIRHIIQNCASENEEMIIICEDDHQFTPCYSKELLFKCIAQAQEHNCDILSGGPSCVKSTFQIYPELYWVEDFTGLQFTIIFKKFFQSIIDFEFCKGNDADIVISNISDNKFLIFPYISTQKEFGYSDVTYKNNITGRVKELFERSIERVQALNDVAAFYDDLKINEFDSSEYESIYFPTYIFYDQTDGKRLEDIQEQFKEKDEFDVTVINSTGYKTDKKAYAEEIKRIIEAANDNDDDIIIICEDTHEFTKHYMKAFFIKSVLEAHQQGAGLLLGGVSDFDSAVLLSESRFWLSSFTKARFIVIFNKMFPIILTETFEDLQTIDHLLSEITSHKMVLFPFISNDLKTASDINLPNLPNPYLSPVSRRFSRIQNANKKLKAFTNIESD